MVARSTADGWNHNTHYHSVLLSAAPRPCALALDVGCGLGGFARRLARVADHVDAIDRDPEVIARARESSGEFRNLRFVEADFLSFESERRYDFVSFVAALHHLPFAEAMTRARDLVRPGGVVAVLGLDRASSWLEAGRRSMLAYPVSFFHRLTRQVAPVGAPIAEPTMTLEEIRREARPLIHPAIIKRHLLWRYSLLWTKPER